MYRLFGALLTITLICVAADCHAQQRQGWLMRGARAQNNSRQLVTRHYEDRIDNSEQLTEFRSTNHNSIDDRISAAPRNADLPSSQFGDPLQAFPKYYGGFHSSHFSNLGIPNGDLGFRGNGIYWAPW